MRDNPLYMEQFPPRDQTGKKNGTQHTIVATFNLNYKILL